MILKFLKKNIIRIILIILCHTQLIQTHATDQCCSTSPTYIENHKKNTHFSEKIISIQSDIVKANYPKQIQFFGNVRIKYNNHTLTSDKLTIPYNNKKNHSLFTLYADGHINYHNNYITLTGEKAWINLNNKNINIYKGTYYLTKPHIHGSANVIMQRKNNHYTIIKQGSFTTCPTKKNYWNVTGSNIIYDYKKNNIDIWNARFEIKKIPIFYSPYLHLALDKENIFTSHIPKIKYSSKYGLILKIPYPIYSSKYILGKISPYYISNIGMKLQTKIHYSIYSNTGLIILNIIKNNKSNKITYLTNDHYTKILKNLHWQHNNITYKKWRFNTHYISKNIPNYFENYKKIINQNINQKFICHYNSRNWDAKIAYLGTARNNSTTQKNYNNYTAAPQLTLNSYYNFYIQKTPFILKTFNQLTKFIPEIHSYPEAIRIHTEPSIHCQINNHWSNLNIETKLKLTHYQQKNTDFYNKTQQKKYQLQNTINRIIPQFKIHGKITLKNKKTTIKKNQYILESKLQYLYTPYFFQENIGIYDSSLIIIDYGNFFNDSIYSGLDRIFPANQITGNIILRYLNNTHELFHISIGQILDLSQYFLKNTNIITNNKYILPKFTLFSGVSQWNLNDRWNAHTEIQYNMQHNNLPFGIATLEYTKKNNYTLQTHYRYINTQYIQKLSSNSNNSIYHKTITQLGMLLYIPICHNWKINCSYYYNIKTKKLIHHTIGFQHYTPCWNINITFERKIIGFEKTNKNSIFDNKIKLNIKISHLKNNSNLNPCKILNKDMIPY